MGKARQDLRRAVSIWKSSMSCKNPRVVFTFDTRLRKTSSQKEAGPMGLPRRVKPRWVMGISGGRGEQEASASSEMKIKNFDLLRLRPTMDHLIR